MFFFAFKCVSSFLASFFYLALVMKRKVHQDLCDKSFALESPLQRVTVDHFVSRF